MGKEGIFFSDKEFSTSSRRASVRTSPSCVIAPSAKLMGKEGISGYVMCFKVGGKDGEGEMQELLRTFEVLL